MTEGSLDRRTDAGRLDALFTKLGSVEQSIKNISDRLDREIIRRIEKAETRADEHEERISNLEKGWAEARGAIRLVQVLVGTSVLGAVLTAVTLFLILSGNGH